MITSTSNNQIKWVKGLIEKGKLRRREKKFVAEGTKMFLEAPASQIEEVFISQEFLEGSTENEAVLKCRDKLKEIHYEVVADDLFRKISDTVTPQGILAVLRFVDAPIQAMLKKEAPLLLVLENIKDPGNLGTIMRTAEGAGVDGILLSEECVDIYNPKVIRSTMGSVYRVPFSYVTDMDEMISALKDKGIKIYGTSLRDSQIYDSYDYAEGTAFLIGNEAAGLSGELLDKSDCKIKIPMEGKVESLNAGVATSILIYEAYRQRRKNKNNQT